MLTEAQIELLDEAGHVEDRVRIVGAGEVTLATRGEPRLQVTAGEPADVDAVIALRGGVVTIEVKKHRVLRVNDELLISTRSFSPGRSLVPSLFWIQMLNWPLSLVRVGPLNTLVRAALTTS